MAARSIVSKHQELPGLYFKGRPFCRRNAFSEVIEAAFSALGKELEDFDLGGWVVDYPGFKESVWWSHGKMGPQSIFPRSP